MNRRDFFKGVAAVVAGALTGFGAPQAAAAIITPPDLLLPIREIDIYEGWAAKVYKLYPAASGEMLGPEWWMTDDELAAHRLSAQ